MSWLASLTFRARLLLALLIVSALLFVIGGAATLGIGHEIGQGVLNRSAVQEAELLRVALAEPLVLRDYPTAEQLLRKEVEAGNAQMARLTIGPVRLEAVERAASPLRPRWFAWLLGLQPGRAEAAIVIGGRDYGRLTIEVGAAEVEDRFWRLYAVGVLAGLGAALLLAWSMHHIMRHNLAGLEAIRESARRFVAGESGSRIVLSKDAPPELVETAAALNAAREQLQTRMDELATEKERWRVTLASVGDGVVVVDADGSVRFLNPAAERLTGWPLAEAYGKAIETVMPLRHEDSRAAQPNPARLALRSNAPQAMANHTLLLARDGRELPVQDSAAPIESASGGLCGAVLVFRDDSERRAMLKELRRLAFHDPLTDLPNRRALEGRLARALRQVCEEGRSHVFCYIDLDQFKLVNDTCGHAAGDALLVEIVDLMRDTVPPTSPQQEERSLLARLGGDEFGLLLFDLSLDEGVAIAQRMVAQISAHVFRYEARQFHIGASIGVTPLEADMNVGEALRRADTACYLAKNQGRNRVEVHSPAHAGIRALGEEMLWIAQLDETLAENRFRLFRQRVVPLAATADAGHYEILLRVFDSQGTLTSPAQVLAAVERFSLAHLVDRWVLRTLLDWLVQHPDDKADYALNLSGATLSHADFLPFVREQLERTGIPPQRIIFEITETAVIQHLAEAQRFIAAMRALGCRFCLDDFGAGLSSFAYLKQLPVSVLKIDGSFVRNLIEEPADYVIVNAIAQIGRDLALAVIAEWVENAATLEKLAEIGVTHVQGYHLHRPEPLPS